MFFNLEIVYRLKEAKKEIQYKCKSKLQMKNKSQEMN